MIGFACGIRLQAQRVSIDAALHNGDKPYIEATGEATVSAMPDRAIVGIGVVTHGTTASAAAEENAKQTDAVLADLRNILKANDTLKTTNYSVRPSYQVPKPGASAAISGYVATNLVEVTLNELVEVATVIDRSTRSGANLIQNLQYRLKNPHAARAQALREAAEQAKASAEAIALGLGLRISRVLSATEGISEEGFGMAKKAPLAASPSGTTATPIEVGTIEVDATVTIRVEIGQ